MTSPTTPIINGPALEFEDRVLDGISLPAATEGQLALWLGNIEDTVHENRGVWWRRAGVGFYQPCFPLSAVDHRASSPLRLRAIAGYTHVAAPGTPSNSLYRTIARRDVASYRFATLPKDRRTNLRKALSALTIRPIESLRDLLDDGYQVYLSCHSRVRWGRDKSNLTTFQKWITRTYRQKGFALGAYKDAHLIGLMIPHRIGDTIVMSYTASHTGFLQYRPNDALYHGLLSLARQSPGVEQVDFGPMCAKTSLNQFKMSFATLCDYPAYTWINPLFRSWAWTRIRSRYPWLTLNPAQGEN